MRHVEKANMQDQRIHYCDCNIAELMILDLPDFRNIYSKNIDESYCLTPDSMRSVKIHDVLYK